MFSRALVLVVCGLSLVARAQADGQWVPAPMPVPSPVASGRPAPLPTDPIRAGVQFHGELQGGTTGTGVASFGPTVSVGLGLNRLAILLTPSLTLASGTTAIALGVSVRIYFKNREQGVLVGFLRPSAVIGSLATGGGIAASSVFYAGLGLGGGGEYLLTRNLGLTAELGLGFSSLGLSAFGASPFAALSTVASVGLMLHQ